MNEPYEICWHRDKTLFTPGPLTTSLSVKQAMLRDAGSWHYEFHVVVNSIRDRLLGIAGVSRETDGYEVVLLQGSGTFGVESVFASCVPMNGKVLVISNGAYGERMLAMLKLMRIEQDVLRTAENESPTPEMVENRLKADPGITHVAVVHCETTTGILNPIHEIGEVVQRNGRQYIVDAMSSFGAFPIHFQRGGIDYLISSPNKCLEGVPGFTYVILRRALLEANRGHQRSLSLDLLHQMEYFEQKNQFRYTPPTHTLLAFHQALLEFEAEGGIEGRERRYRRNHAVLMEEMERIGFRPYLDGRNQSPIITAFYFPGDKKFEFKEFYRLLSDQGMIIYPGKLTVTECFRIGNIGRIFEHDIRQLVQAIKRALDQMGVSL